MFSLLGVTFVVKSAMKYDKNIRFPAVIIIRNTRMDKIIRKTPCY